MPLALTVRRKTERTGTDIQEREDLGWLTLVAGILALLSPLVSGLAVAVLLIIAAFQARPTQGWGILLFSGIVSIVLSLLVWSQWPLSGAWAIGVLVDIQLLFSGMTKIVIGVVIKDVAEA